MMFSFSDESVREDCGDLLFVGGYLLEKPQAKRLNKQWSKQITFPFRELTGGKDFHCADLERFREKYGRHVIDRFERRAVY